MLVVGGAPEALNSDKASASLWGVLVILSIVVISHDHSYGGERGIGGSQLRQVKIRGQACKPQSYSSLKLRPTQRLTRVKCSQKDDNEENFFVVFQLWLINLSPLWSYMGGILINKWDETTIYHLWSDSRAKSSWSSTAGRVSSNLRWGFQKYI